MDLDSLYFSSLLKTKKAQFLKGMAPRYFEGEWVKVFKFVRTFFSQFGKLPTLTTVKQKFKDRPFFKATESATFYGGEMRDRHSLMVLDEAMQEVYTPARAKGDIVASVDAMKEAIQKVQRTKKDKSGGVLRINKGMDWRKKEYLLRKKKKGLLGIPTPWPSLDRVTQGWQAGDLPIFLARPSIGKTFGAVLCTLAAQASGASALLASMEMMPKRLGIRYDALGAGISVEHFRKGKLSKKEKKKLDAWYKRLEEDASLGQVDIAGPAEISSPLDLELAINLGQYDFVVWDSFYLASRKKKWEEFAQLVADLKNLATRCGVPILLTSQFNKDVKIKHSYADISAAAFTDSIVQDADFVFAWFQTPAMKLVPEMLLRSLKIREGVDLSELLLKWDIDKGDFSEISATLLSDSIGDPSIDNEGELTYDYAA